ncbi:MAG: cysteine synthase family protein [Acidobacteriota bacterium]
MRSPFNDALGLIGNTPLVHLARIHSGPGRLYAKVEFVQPGGSIKDRAALRILKDAYATGELMRGQPVVEMTSGNMGSGLAVVCNVLGNPFVAVMSEGNSPERASMLEALGAEVVLVPQVDGAPGQVTGPDISAAVDRAKALAGDKGAFYVDQFNRIGSVLAHEQGTGPEIWEALQGKVDAFVAAVGSGGTFVGSARFLKQGRSKVLCAVVEPAGCEVLAGNPVTKARHLLQGIGYGSVPPHWDASLADRYLAVSDSEAQQYRQLLAETEGLYVGYSAAANVCAAVRLLNEGAVGQDGQVVTVLCDTGLKYQSAGRRLEKNAERSRV